MADSSLQNATLLQVVEHAYDGPPVALIELATGEQRYATLFEWERRAQPEPQTAPAPAGNPPYTKIVTSRSSTAEKITLFRSLFRGREDVFALGYRRRDGGISYSPVCRNKFRPGLCGISRGSKKPCATCENLSYAPLTDEVLIAHFKGTSPDYRDVAGLYVLREDETCSVLVADFDDDGWAQAVSAYRAAALANDLSVAVERSRSGSGAHAWLFFRDPVPAELARKLGFLLLEQALSLSKAVRFSAFDRLFPAQSTLQRGGIGNLIALPLQGRAYREGNSVFVNERLEPYEDQWSFLSSVERVDEKSVRTIVDAHASASDRRRPPRAAREPSLLDAMLPSARPTGSAAVPDDQPKAPADPDLGDFPPRLTIRKSDMLYLRQDDVSPRGRASLLKIASFGNPAFYRAQAMHLNVRSIPRIICLAEEDEDSIALPRGCEDQLLNLLATAGVTASVVDERPSHAPISVSFVGRLREGQKTAADALLVHDLGVLSAPTGFGKTVIGAYLIASTCARTLVIVPSVSLLNQWRARIAEFLDIREEPRETLTKTGRRRRLASPVGQIGGGRVAPGGVIDIATLQSLVVEGDVPGTKVACDLVRDYDLVIVDECHHGAAPTLETVLRSLTARRVYGLSATPRRDDGLERIVFMHCGPIRHSVSAKDQARAQGFERLLVPRFTHMRYPTIEPGTSSGSVLTTLQESKRRNALIVEDVVSAVRSGRHALVLTKRKEHVELLARALSEQIDTVVALTGAGTATQKRERLERVRAIPDGAPFALVATGSYVGEGFDEPRLDALFVALPISCEAVVTQYSGRLHRETDGKRDVLIYDYIDTTVPMLDRMYQRRIKTYAKLGYRVAADASDAVKSPGHAIFDRQTYWQRLTDDLGAAERSIVIAAPYASEKYVRTLSPALADAVRRGLPVDVWVADPTSSRYAESRARACDTLAAVGCTVHPCGRVASSFAVIDGRLLWYGSLPLLAFPRADECSLRIEDAELSAELLARLGGEDGEK